jgi:hypothetical protein
MHTVSAWFYRVSSWPAIILAVVAYGLFLSQVMVPHAQEMQSFAGDWGAPDGHFFYVPEKLYSEVATWSDEGRSHYVDFRLGLDPVWALVYTAFLVTITSVALRRATHDDDRRRLLNVLPLVPMCADLLENALGIYLVSSFPDRTDWLAWLAAITTSFKWITLGIAHLIMLYAITIALGRKRS